KGIHKRLSEFEQEQHGELELLINLIDKHTKEINEIKLHIAGASTEKTADGVARENAALESAEGTSIKPVELEMPAEMKEKINGHFGVVGVEVGNYKPEDFLRSLIEMQLIPYSNAEEVPDEVKETLELYRSIFNDMLELIRAKQNLKQAKLVEQLNN